MTIICNHEVDLSKLSPARRELALAAESANAALLAAAAELGEEGEDARLRRNVEALRNHLDSFSWTFSLDNCEEGD